MTTVCLINFYFAAQRHDVCVMDAAANGFDSVHQMETAIDLSV